MKTALITGASSGIGTAFAQELAMRQINLILVARSQNKLYQLAEKLQHQAPIKVEVIVQDLTDQQAAKKVYDTVAEKGLNVDFLVNNEGF
ncbi:MAG: SDR family NAD(P)-dependent oxidoreductase, partial [cyanobacterium endosymbiont of Rhopalodia yunnanensis]